MRVLQKYLTKILSLLVWSILLSVTGHGQSRTTPGALTSRPCTTATGLYCEIYGSGDPMLFLAGLGGSTYSWRHMVAPLMGQHTLILIDLRGQGKSPKPKDKKYSVLDQRDLIYEFIVEHDLKNLTLVGNSYRGKACRIRRLANSAHRFHLKIFRYVQSGARVFVVKTLHTMHYDLSSTIRICSFGGSR